jgi:hypothetical protein
MNGGTLAGGELIVRNTASGTGTFQGRGTPTMTGALTNNGRVIADGGSLNLGSFSSVSNAIDNSTINGWYAQNQGKLQLPSFTVATGTNTYTWGESGGDTTIDLVNSVRGTFANVANQGVFTIVLQATDRPEVPAIAAGGKAIGFWDISHDANFAFGGSGYADLIFRYDDALAASLGITEADLKLYHYTAGAWQDVTTSIDTDNNLLYARTNSFSPFGAGDGFTDNGSAVPEPATVISFLLGGAGLAAKRFIRKKR